MSAVLGAPARTAASDRPPVRVKRRRWTSYILPLFTGAMILYLAAPVFLMIVYGFNDIAGERQTAKFTCCTIKWWQQMFNDPSLNSALKTSVWIAFVSATCAAALGAFIGLALGRYAFRGRAGLNFVIFLAIAVPEIVLGASLLGLFIQTEFFTLGYLTILLSHIGFSVAFVAITVRARVQGLDDSLENAAQDLYATPSQSFFKVTLPLILPGIVAGFLLAFVLSLDDFVITNFVSGSKNTFPTWVYGAARIGVPPQVNVWGTVLFAAGIVVAVSQVIGGRRTDRRNAT